MWCTVVHVPDSAVFPEPSTPQRMLLASGCTCSAAHPPAPGACSSPLHQKGPEPFPLWSLLAAVPSWSWLCQQTWGKHRHREFVPHFLNERNETKAGFEHSLQYTCLKGKAECRARLTTSPQHLSLDCNKQNRNIWYKVAGRVIRKLFPGCLPSPSALRTNFHLWSIHYPWLSSHCYCQSKRRLYLPSATLNY